MAQRSQDRGEHVVVDDLTALLEGLPPHIREPLIHQASAPDLLEVVMDLGREPEARFLGRDVILSESVVSEEDIDFVIQHIGAFGDDNRAGIERTLHRISAIRNRTGRVVGLTMRVGRAVYGTIAIIRDIVETGRSLLLLGRPGVGKTTMLRETARVLAVDLGKRVIIVDTSNEIAGDGDIPHPAIGRARRMQVPTPLMQHQIMIEAVENHMPEVIVIDEIGTELEAAAARTIAERGVQLIATAHGNTLENLIMNPTLSDLIGGIQTVTLGDDEARRRGTQKSVLERKAPPTFDVLVEIQERERVAVHEEVAEVVDSYLRGTPSSPIIRYRDERGEIRMTQGTPPRLSLLPTVDRGPGGFGGGGRSRRPNDPWRIDDVAPSYGWGRSPSVEGYERTLGEPLPPPEAALSTAPSATASSAPARGKALRVYPFGVNRARLEQAIRQLQSPAIVVSTVQEADVAMTVKNYYRRKPQPLRDAEALGIPIHVLRSNTGSQIEEALLRVGRGGASTQATEALQEVEDAVNEVLANSQPAVELAPQNAYIRRLQHQVAERYNVSSRSTGREPFRRVMVYRPEEN